MGDTGDESPLNEFPESGTEAEQPNSASMPTSGDTMTAPATSGGIT